MYKPDVETDPVYMTARQLLPRGIVEYRWNTAGGEILGHRNERLIADLREALHYRAACPESSAPSLSLLGRRRPKAEGRAESAIRLRLLRRYPSGRSGVTSGSGPLAGAPPIALSGS